MRSAFAGAVLLLAPGCSGVLGSPTITRFAVEPRKCGAWSAAFGVTGVRGHDVVLFRDGAEIRRYPSVWGAVDWSVEDGEPIAFDTSFEVRIEGTDAHASRVAERINPSVDGLIRPSPTSFTPGTEPRFDLSVEADCDVPGLRWRASTGNWSGEGAVSGARTPLVLPVHPDGPHVLRVDLFDAHERLGQAEGRFVVGTRDENDRDEDGSPAWQDCDDQDDTVSPEAPEAAAPNGRDEDCDGIVDEGTAAYDDDGDGLTEQAGDCNDRDDRVRPGAAEQPNCRDDDCDGTVDEGTTLPHADDGFEKADGIAYRWDGIGRRFAEDVRIVSRDANDRELFQFWSDDGGWDTWGIDVVGDRIPADSRYQVEIRRVDGGIVATGELAADGDVVAVSGAAFRDDSGFYEVLVRPLALHSPWCPAELTLLSR